MINWDQTFDEQIRIMPDAHLRTVYALTSRKPGDPSSKALPVEIKHRGLDL